VQTAFNHGEPLALADLLQLFGGPVAVLILEDLPERLVAHHGAGRGHRVVEGLVFLLVCHELFRGDAQHACDLLIPGHSDVESFVLHILVFFFCT